MKKRDLNEIAKLENAIKEKYGTGAIANPKGSWNEEKEKEHLKQLKKFYERTKRENKVKQTEGFLFKDKKTKLSPSRTCSVCETYSFATDDDLYMIKYDCCFNCYIQHVEDREQRWKSGWRPNN
jgi:hypothetical protein